MSDLTAALRRADGRPYPAYRDLRGRDFAVGPWSLRFEHVQGDPFAAPSRLRITGPAALPPLAREDEDARRATADLLHRALVVALGRVGRGGGSGKSGLLEIAPLGEEVLARTAVEVPPEGPITLRLVVGLPAAGRRVLGREADALLGDRLPRALSEALRVDPEAVRAQVRCVQDQVALRAQLEAAGLEAFLADGSVLPRRTGVDDRPLSEGEPLRAPEALAVHLRAPHAGRLRGLGVPAGVTLIVGGGYHGKSTLLSAIARGVYDHRPGDGRERCVSRDDAVWVRAEDGRAVRGVDLRPFIDNLPHGRPTARFDSEDASGSTSQAAAIVEALEAGAGALLIDEDTAATNFMVRDARMRRLVPGAREPITPYLDRVRQLADEQEVSSILVVGGAGDYLDVADTVILMDAYQPRDATEEARAVARALPLGEAAPHAPGPWPEAAPRRPTAACLDPSSGRRGARVRSVKTRAIEFGREEIDISALQQLVDPAQARWIGDALLWLSRGACDGRRSVEELLDALEGEGLRRIAAPGFGDRAQARRHEIAAALNRLRGLRVG